MRRSAGSLDLSRQPGQVRPGRPTRPLPSPLRIGPVDRGDPAHAMRITSRPCSRPTALLLATALTVLLVAPSCGSSDPQADPPSPTAPTDPTVAPPETTPDGPIRAEEIGELLDHYWSVWLTANNPPNPDDPRLRDVLVGSALEITVSKVRERADAHQAIVLPGSGPPRHGLLLTSPGSDPNHVGAVECVVDNTILIDSSSGAIINDATATYEILVDLERDSSGTLRISRRVQQARSEGATGCANEL